MDYKQKSCRIFLRTTFSLIWLLGTALPIFAEGSTKQVKENWRPKDGIYAGAGEFLKSCGDAPDLFVDLANKSFNGGGEEDCKIIKLTDTARGAVAFDVSCTSVEKEAPYKKIIILKKLDEKTIFWRSTVDGKFKYPGVRVSYCPEELQRSGQKAKN